MTASDRSSAGDRSSAPRRNPVRSPGIWAMAGLGAVLLALASAALVAPLTASGDSPTVQIVTDATYGSVLANSAGLPLYTLNTDHNGKSTCTGACLQAWPPLTVPAGATPTAGPGVSQDALGMSVQSDGRHQVTYNGSPLYTFVSDTSGKVTGQNVAGFVVVQVQPQSPPTTTAPPTPTTTAPPGPTTTMASPTRGPTTTMAPARIGTTGGGATTATGGSPYAGGATSASGASASASSSAGSPSDPATAAAGGTTAAGGTAVAPGALAVTGPGDGLRLVLALGLLAMFAALVLLALARSTTDPVRSSTRE